MENEATNMNGQLTVKPQHTIAPPQQFDAAQIELIKRTVCKGATKDEFDLFIAVCKLRGLNPLTRQIYAIKRKAYNSETRQYEYNMVHQTGIDGFRLIAERTGKYGGQEGPYWTEDGVTWLDAWVKDTPPKAAKVGIIRHGFRQTLWAMARFNAYCPRGNDGQPTGVWRNIGEGQIAKCAEALGLRRAFPEELSGLYISEEMHQAKDEIVTVADATYPEADEDSPGPAEVAQEAKRPQVAPAGNCPSCGHKLMVSKFNPNELYCNAKAGGCGKKFPGVQKPLGVPQDQKWPESVIVTPPAPQPKGEEPSVSAEPITAPAQPQADKNPPSEESPKPITRGQANLLRKRLTDAGLIVGNDTTKAITWLAEFLELEVAYDDSKSGSENLDTIMRTIDGDRVGALKDAIETEMDPSGQE